MRLVRTALLISGVILSADDPWGKVRELKSGAEVRIFKKGTRQPILAAMDELKEESLLVVVKNEQTAIPRDQIDRIDARPRQGSSHVVTETKSTSSTAAAAPPPSSPKERADTATATTPKSMSTNVTFQGKPDFEVVYRRTAAVPPTK